jgi:hypothetical protein
MIPDMKPRKKTGSGNRPPHEQDWKQVITPARPMKPANARRAKRRLNVWAFPNRNLATVPHITPLLQQADGGLKTIIAAMRFAPGSTIGPTSNMELSYHAVRAFFESLAISVWVEQSSIPFRDW